MTQPYFLPKTADRPKKQRVPSVTTVLADFKNPGALMRWASNVAVEQLDEALYLLNQYQRKMEEVVDGKIDIQPMDHLHPAYQSTRRYLRTDPKKKANYQNVSRAATTAGTYVHDYVEQWIHSPEHERRQMEKITPDDFQKLKNCDAKVARQAWKATQAFFTWAESNHFELCETEIPLVSEKYAYGGTIDCIAWMDSTVRHTGRRYPLHDLVLLDWKTSKRLYTDYIIQIGAYGELWFENYDQPIDRYHLVRFDKETGVPEHKEFSSHEIIPARDAFLRLREVYEYNKQIERIAG